MVNPLYSNDTERPVYQQCILSVLAVRCLNSVASITETLIYRFFCDLAHDIFKEYQMSFNFFCRDHQKYTESTN